MVDEWSLLIYWRYQLALHQRISYIQKCCRVWCLCSLEWWQWPSAISLLTCSIRRLIGHGTSNNRRDLRPHRHAPRANPWGLAGTASLTFARQQWGVSRAQGYRLLKRAWTQIKADVDETGIDRQELLAWSIQTLMAAAGQAKQQKNPGAVVACINNWIRWLD